MLKGAQTAFVTFEKMSSAQVAIQVAHAPAPLQAVTKPAPEPRDIVWCAYAYIFFCIHLTFRYRSNMTPSQRSIMTRDTVVMALMGLLLFFWCVARLHSIITHS